jgi:O-antigen/teichoic acid export membrane protein
VPFGLSSFLAMVYGQADVVIVAFVLGAGAAGIYAPAISIVVALTLVAGTLFPVMVPVLSQKQATDPANLPAAARKLLLASLGLGVVLALFLLVSGPALALLLYGPSYAQVGVILQILSGVLLLRSPIFAAGAVLVAVGRQRQRVVVQAVSAGANVSLNLLLVGATGVIGVAFVYIFSELILITGQLLILWRHGHLRSPNNAALHP